MSLRGFCAVSSRIRRFGSRLPLKNIRLLLWMIRRPGFMLATDNGRVVYQWVRDFDSGFDHWFMFNGSAYAVSTARRRLGSWRLAWEILNDSELLLGERSRYHKETIMARSERYYCLEIIFQHTRYCG
jgi:hypothetical protein